MSAKTRLDRLELLKSGWLYKQVGGVMRSWQKRWFALTENGRLVYFKSRSASGQPRGVYYLSDCRLVCDRGTLCGQKGTWPTNIDHRRCFALVNADKLVCLYAQTKEDCWSWVKVLEKSRQECPSPPPDPSPPPSPVRKSASLEDDGGLSLSVADSAALSCSRDSLSLSIDGSNTGIQLSSSASASDWSQVHDKAQEPALPNHVTMDIQQSLLMLYQSLGNINATTGTQFSFMCNLGKIFNNIPPTVEERDRMGSIIYGKYLSVLSERLVSDLTDPAVKSAFLERVHKKQILFKLGQSPFALPLSPHAAIWIQDGILYLAVPNFHFGKHPFEPPSACQIPIVGVSDLPESGASVLFAETAWQEMWEAGRIDLLPARVKEDIYDAAHLLEGSLQAISRAAQRSFRFECEFDTIYENLPDSQYRKYIGSVVYGEYLLPLSVAIVKYCEDTVSQECFLSHVYNHQIVFCLGTESQNTSIIYKHGTLSILVSPQQFGSESFQPDLTLLSMRPQNSSELEMLSNNHIIYKRLPSEIQQDIEDAAPFLQSALKSLAALSGEEFTFKCNFEEVCAATRMSLRNRDIPGSTVFANYLTPTCDSIIEYLRGDIEARRPKFLDQIHCRQIFFSCGQPPASVTRRGEEKKAVAFSHRGTFHIICPGSEFGKERFNVDISKLISLPDEEELYIGAGSDITNEWLRELLGSSRQEMNGSLSRTSSCSTWTTGSRQDLYVQPSEVLRKSQVDIKQF
eukprot:m.307923 g.307923  ORF g.307923 m.307923 type:complete len:742 (+) comp43032_c0_seq1:119-2344(+)